MTDAFVSREQTEHNDNPAVDATRSNPNNSGGGKLAAALAWAAAGFSVFPCVPGGKNPATEHGHRDATTDRASIERWWTEDPNRNIGVVPSSAGCSVIDLDGTEGKEAWAELCHEHGAVHTFASGTPSGGTHVWFRGNIPCTVKKIGRGIDTRGINPDGKAGYVLVAPSIVKGSPYRQRNAARRF